MKYQIEYLTFFYGWINPWTDDAENPITFDSREEAQKELDLFLQEQPEPVLCSGTAEDYDINEFRIVQLGVKNEA